MTKTDPFYTQLKLQRKSQNICLSEISKKTKIRLEFLNAIEEGDFDAIPKVYIRLFLIAYAKEIGTNSKKTIEELEIYLYGKKTQIKNTIKKNEKESISNATLDTTSNPLNINVFNKKIITGIITVIILYILFDYLENLTKDIQSISNEDISMNEIIPILQDSSLSDTNIINSSINSEYPIYKDPLQKPSIAESIFSLSNKLSEENITLGKSNPIITSFQAKENTIVHLRSSINDSTIYDDTFILSKDSIKTIEIIDEFYFDIININQVLIIINNKQISTSYNNDITSIRGSITSEGYLNLQYYK